MDERTSTWRCVMLALDEDAALCRCRVIEQSFEGGSVARRVAGADEVLAGLGPAPSLAHVLVEGDAATTVLRLAEAAGTLLAALDAQPDAIRAAGLTWLIAVPDARAEDLDALATEVQVAFESHALGRLFLIPATLAARRYPRIKRLMAERKTNKPQRAWALEGLELLWDAHAAPLVARDEVLLPALAARNGSGATGAEQLLADVRAELAAHRLARLGDMFERAVFYTIRHWPAGAAHVPALFAPSAPAVPDEVFMHDPFGFEYRHAVSPEDVARAALDACVAVARQEVARASELDELVGVMTVAVHGLLREYGLDSLAFEREAWELVRAEWGTDGSVGAARIEQGALAGLEAAAAACAESLAAALDDSGVCAYFTGDLDGDFDRFFEERCCERVRLAVTPLARAAADMFAGTEEDAVAWAKRFLHWMCALDAALPGPLERAWRETLAQQLRRSQREKLRELDLRDSWSTCAEDVYDRIFAPAPVSMQKAGILLSAER